MAENAKNGRAHNENNRNVEAIGEQQVYEWKCWYRKTLINSWNRTKRKQNQNKFPVQTPLPFFCCLTHSWQFIKCIFRVCGNREKRRKTEEAKNTFAPLNITCWAFFFSLSLSHFLNSITIIWHEGEQYWFKHKLNVHRICLSKQYKSIFNCILLSTRTSNSGSIYTHIVHPIQGKLWFFGRVEKYFQVSFYESYFTSNFPI